MVLKKLKKSKKNKFGLGAFPMTGLDLFPAIDEDIDMSSEEQDFQEQNVENVHQEVPKVPDSFYNYPKIHQDSLMDEINKLNQNKFVGSHSVSTPSQVEHIDAKPIDTSRDEDISMYLKSLQFRIKADQTWFAINFGSQGQLRMINPHSQPANNLSTTNELVNHAMSINHLMLVKNKNYIDGLFDNQTDLYSLFIVPVHTDSANGMLLAGYKNSRSTIDDIVVALDKSKSTLATFL